MFAPVFHAASEQHPDITFGKVDTKAEQQLAALTVSTLGQLIQAVRELDMDDVRRQIAEHAPARSA
jgi:thioredoxin 1